MSVLSEHIRRSCLLLASLVFNFSIGIVNLNIHFKILTKVLSFFNKNKYNFDIKQYFADNIFTFLTIR